jgi:large subunit ribosomal protein L37e
MSTASFGKHGKRSSHIMCRRCGRRSYHTRKKECSKCGFGRSSRKRLYAWQTKKNGKRAW